MYRLANFSSRFGVATAGRGPSIRPGLASALRLSVARRCFETEAMSLSTSVNIAPRLLSSKSMWLSQARSMGSASGETGGDTFLPSAEVAERIIGVLKAFDKVDASKVTDKSHFINDLGLDSLDAVEVVMVCFGTSL